MSSVLNMPDRLGILTRIPSDVNLGNRNYIHEIWTVTEKNKVSNPHHCLRIKLETTS